MTERASQDGLVVKVEIDGVEKKVAQNKNESCECWSLCG